MFSVDNHGRIRVREPDAIDFEKRKLYGLQIEARDPLGLVGSSQVDVRVINENEPPSVRSYSFSIAENSAVGIKVGTLQVTDPDGHSVLMGILSGNTGDAFEIRADGSLVIKESILNFENSAYNYFELVVRAIDDDSSSGPEFSSEGPSESRFTVKITVTDVNERPTITDGQMLSVDENTAQNTPIGTPISAIDVDMNQMLEYSIVKGNDDKLFSIESCSGQLKVGPGIGVSYKGCRSAKEDIIDLDSLHGPFIDFPSIISFCTGLCSDYAYFGIRDAKYCYCVPSMKLAFGEDLGDESCGSTCINDDVGKHCGNDVRFSVYHNSVGFDAESQTDYTLTIAVRDSGRPQLSHENQVAVSITDVNEAPIVWALPLSIAEGNALDRNVGLAALVLDPDDDTWTSSITSCCKTPCPFRLDNSSSTHLLTSVALDYETSAFCSMTLQITDDGGLVSKKDILVSIVDINDAPFIESAVLEVVENSPPSSTIGAPIIAGDEDAGQSVSYSIISGTGRSCFDINPVSGQVSVKNSACLDYETMDYSSWISPLETGTKSVSTVDNEIYCTVTSLAFPSQKADKVKLSASIQLHMPDYESSQEDEIIKVATEKTRIRIAPENVLYTPSLTTISNSGCLTDMVLCGTLEFEVPQLQKGQTLEFQFGDFAYTTLFDVDNLKKMYELDVEVKDSNAEPLTTQSKVYVDVLDINEPPVFASSLPDISVDENEASGTTVGPELKDFITDPDSKVHTFSIQSQSVAGAFRIDVSTGQLRVLTTSVLDAESLKNGISVTILVSDGSTYVTQVFKISVADVDERPVPHCGSVEISEAIAVDADVGESIKVEDDDGDTEFKFTMNANAFFGIHKESGQVHVVNLLDFEQFNQRSHSLIIQATDASELAGECTMTVTVSDVNESPSGPTEYTRNIPENAPADFMLLLPEVTDPEKDSLTYSIKSSTAGDLFTINSATGVVALARADELNVNTDPEYTIEMSATDSKHVFDYSLRIVVIDSNDPPSCPSPKLEFQVNEGTKGAKIGVVTATDPEKGLLIYGLLFENSQSVPYSSYFYVDSDTGEFYASVDADLDFETASSYDMEYAATDPEGLLVICSVKIQIKDVDEAVTCADMEVDITENVFPDGTYTIGTMSATDPEGKAIVYSLTESFNGLFEITSGGTLIVSRPEEINHEVKDSYEVVVSAADQTQPATTCKATISVLDANDCPVIRSTHLNVDENTPRDTPVGSRIDVVDEDIVPGSSGRLVFSIESTSVENAFKIDAATGQIRVNDLLNYESLYNPSTKKSQIDLVTAVVDDHDPSCKTTKTIPVYIANVNEAPFIGTGQSVSIQESAPRSQTNFAEPIITVTADDYDLGDVLSYSLRATDDAKAFRIHRSSGRISVVEPKLLDFESLSKTTLDLSVQVTDSYGLTATETVGITVTDVNEDPVFSSLDFYVSENQVQGIISPPLASMVVDPDSVSVENHIFSIVEDASNLFEIVNGNLQLKAAQSLDFETLGQYPVGLRVCDPGNLCTTSTVAVHVVDVNEEPVMSNIVRSIAENSPKGTPVEAPLPAQDEDVDQNLSFSIASGNDQDIFAIQSCSGQIRVQRDVLDFERVQEYILMVKVSDDFEPPKSITRQVTIKVTPQDDRQVYCSEASLEYNSRYVQSIPADLTSAQVAREVTEGVVKSGYCQQTFESAIDLRNEDLCGATSNIGFQINVIFVLEQPRNFKFSLTGPLLSGIAIAVDGIYQSVATIAMEASSREKYQTSSSVELRRGHHEIIFYGVTSTDGEISIEFKPDGENWKTVTVDELNALRSFSKVLKVDENTAADTPIGSPLVAVDEDADTEFIYVIEQQETTEPFRIDSSSGQLYVKNSKALDFETISSFEIVISATDTASKQLQTTCVFTVNVENISEPPSLVTKVVHVLESWEANTNFGPLLEAIDQDTGTKCDITFSLTPVEGLERFGITSSGQLFTTAGTVLDYETEPLYTIEVVLQDESGLTSKNALSIVVDNVNERPVFVETETTANIKENSAVGTAVLSIFADDPEKRVVHFSIESITPATTAFRISHKASGVAQIEVAQNTLDFEAQDEYTVSLRVTDVGDLVDTMQVTISIDDVPENPVPKESVFKYSVNENSPNGLVIGPYLYTHVTDQDGNVESITTTIIRSFPREGVFSVNADQKLVVARTDLLDYETETSFRLEVRATDETDRFTEYVIQVDVLDVNEAPLFFNDELSFFVRDNVPVGATVYTFDAFDPEGKQDEIRYDLADGDTEMFSIDSASGNLITKKAFDPFDGVNEQTFNLKVRVTDDNGTGASNTVDLKAHVFLDYVNESPMFKDYYTFEVNENEIQGKAIGTIEIHDPDIGTTVTFSIPSRSSYFAVVSTGPLSAEIQTTMIPTDFECTPPKTLVVCVTDDGSEHNGVGTLTTCSTINIVVLDKNENPKIDLETCKVRTVQENIAYQGKRLEFILSSKVLTFV